MKRYEIFILLFALVVLRCENILAQNTIQEAIQKVQSISDPDPFKQNKLRAEEAKRIIMARIRTTNPNATDPPEFKDLNDEMDLLREGDVAKGRKPAAGDELINWSWENRAGRCTEQVNLMKKILEASGVNVVTITAGNHIFPVVNMDKDAALDIPWTWGPHAIAPDTWVGRTLTPEGSWNEPFHFDGGKKNAGDPGRRTTREYLEVIGSRPDKIDGNCQFKLQSGKLVIVNYRDMLNNYFKIPEEYRKALDFRPKEDIALEAGEKELEEIHNTIDRMNKNDPDEVRRIHGWINDLDGRFGQISRCCEKAVLFRKKVNETFKLIPKLKTDATFGVPDTGLDEVPDDIAKNTGHIKVDQYFVFLLTNASHGLYIGTIESMKTAVRCSFIGGGINCKPTDLVTYKKLLGPFATSAEAQGALCKNITETKYFPIGVGLKGRWQGGNTWYGLWNASVSDCPSR